MPDETYRAALSKRRGIAAARIKDPKERREFIAKQAEMKGEDEKLEQGTSMRVNRQALVSYKKGGKVKKTGPAMLHKGERVVPAKPKGAFAYDFRKQRGRRASPKMRFKS